MTRSRSCGGVGAYLVLVSLLLLALTGCFPSGAETDRSTNTIREERITLGDGRTITCVIYKSGYAGGLSCDWNNYE